MDYKHNALTDRYLHPETGIVINAEDMPAELLPTPAEALPYSGVPKTVASAGPTTTNRA